MEDEQEHKCKIVFLGDDEEKELYRNLKGYDLGDFEDDDEDHDDNN